MRLNSAAGVVLAIAGTAAIRAQPPARSNPAFDVASVRPAAPGDSGGAGRGGGGGGCPESFRINPGRIEIHCAALGSLITHAFRIPQYRIDGPEWTNRQGPKFDMEATFSESVPENQIPEMLQTLLTERFRLAAHRGSRQEEVYALVVAKSGLKIKSAVDAGAPVIADDPNSPPPSITTFGGLETRETRIPNADGTGFTTTRSNPRLGTVRQTDGPNFTTHLEAPSITPEGLVDLLSPVGLSLEIVDMTQLQGRYRVVLDFSLSGAFAAAAAMPQPGGDPTARDNARMDMQNAILSALNDGLLKLGLQLERRKGTVETLVIDHVEKAPTGN
jgi:uncharacterized protein (TIGR03435 family)